MSRIAWLERQLGKVDGFIERDTERLRVNPASASIKISLESWQDHHKELSDELAALRDANPPAPG